MSGVVPGHVVVVGEALIDEFDDQRVVGGAPFNVARTLSSLGLPVLMITRIADDSAGELVRRSAERHGLGLSGVQVDDRLPTGRVLVERSGDDHRFTILKDQAWDHLDAAGALACLDGLDIAALYCGTLAQRSPVTRGTVQRLLEVVRAPHFVDLNLRTGEFEVPVIARTLQRATVLKANADELRDLLEWFVHPAARGFEWGSPDQLDAVQQLVAQFGIDRLLVTRGAEGATAFDADGSRESAAGSPPPATWGDAVGAGDAFSAVYLAGSLLGWPLALTLSRANAFASATCGIAGAVPDDPSFYPPWRRAWGIDRELHP